MSNKNGLRVDSFGANCYHYSETDGRRVDVVHEYCKILPDTENIVVTFTDIHFSPTRGESITVRFEQATENGFKIADPF